MKKSLIALAALTAFAGAASAQSSVTIGGFVDLGAGKYTGSSDKGIIDGGGTGGSRLNFNMVEDLGGGLKAIAGMEHRFSPDTGAQGATNFWGGYSFVGLMGGFGRIKLGRDYTTSFQLVQNQVDPFAGDTVAMLRQASLQVAPAKVRFGNGIRYDSPALGGLTFAFDISEKGLDNNGGAVATNVNKPWSAAVAYAAGPLWLGLSHENPGAKTDKLTNLGARFTIGDLTLRAGAANGTNDANAKVKGYLIGATYAMGAGTFKIGYATNKIATTTQAKRFALGYQYNLSKRTFLYTDFVRDSANLRGYERPAAANAIINPGSNKTGYDFGIRHNF